MSYRKLLDDAVGTAPPSTVDIEGVITRGRRATRLRRFAAGGSVAAGVATVAALSVAASLGLSAPNGGGTPASTPKRARAESVMKTEQRLTKAVTDGFADDFPDTTFDKLDWPGGYQRGPLAFFHVPAGSTSRPGGAPQDYESFDAGAIVRDAHSTIELHLSIFDTEDYDVQRTCPGEPATPPPGADACGQGSHKFLGSYVFTSPGEAGQYPPSEYTLTFVKPDGTAVVARLRTLDGRADRHGNIGDPQGLVHALMDLDLTLVARPVNSAEVTRTGQRLTNVVRAKTTQLLPDATFETRPGDGPKRDPLAFSWDGPPITDPPTAPEGSDQYTTRALVRNDGVTGELYLDILDRAGDTFETTCPRKNEDSVIDCKQSKGPRGETVHMITGGIEGFGGTRVTVLKPDGTAVMVLVTDGTDDGELTAIPIPVSDITKLALDPALTLFP